MAGEGLSWRDGFYGAHGSLRSHPEQLVPGTIRVITARMDYWPETAADAWQVMGDSELGFVSRYALGRDYHKLMRKRLLRLSQRIEEAVGAMGYRVFTDSAPVLEKAWHRNPAWAGLASTPTY